MMGGTFERTRRALAQYDEARKALRDAVDNLRKEISSDEDASPAVLSILGKIEDKNLIDLARQTLAEVDERKRREGI